ncbi:amino acid ABC transporter substrate-binding protein [Microbacterium sp. RD1]|uniref:amino acid ABC transporter substrate-binding protein n=1 Tax=Microbacterium sp. RD1 TaxID=3457313 RepID=UPI003FA60B8D
MSSVTPLPRRLAALAAGIAAAALVLGGCAASQSADAGTEESGPIVIGGTLGLTGTYATAAAAYRETYDYWVEQVNDSGGLLGREVELKIYDDESNPQTAQTLYQQLINEDDVDLLLAPYATAVGGAVVPLAERAGKLLFNGGFFSKELHSKYPDTMVTGWPYQDTEATYPLFDYLESLPEAERPSTVAIATAQNPAFLAARDGYDGEGGALARAEELGMEVVVDEEYDQSATDFSALIQRVSQSGAEVFLGLSAPNDAGLIATAVSQSGYDPDFYCSCGSQVTTLPNWPALGDAAVNVFANSAASTAQDTPGLAELAAHLDESLGMTTLPSYAAVGYTALQVLQQAVEKAGSLDDDTVRAAVAEGTFDTVVGEVTYNDDGTIAFNGLLLQFQSAGNQVIWPADQATADAVVPLRG